MAAPRRLLAPAVLLLALGLASSPAQAHLFTAVAMPPCGTPAGHFAPGEIEVENAHQVRFLNLDPSCGAHRPATDASCFDLGGIAPGAFLDVTLFYNFVAGTLRANGSECDAGAFTVLAEGDVLVPYRCRLHGDAAAVRIVL